MDSKAQRKALFRSKVRESSQKRDKRIDSPLVRYNEYEQPVCRVCNVVLKSEALWPAHQASRKHHEAIENVQAAAAGVSQDSKIHKDQQVEVHKPHSSSILPEGFFDNQEAKRAKSGVDLVVHAAGPFQQEKNCKVLAAAIRTKTAYVDVCDDRNYAMQAKSYHEEALSASVPAITTGGIYPGVSNVMAAELVRIARSESAGEPERLRDWWCWSNNIGNKFFAPW